MPDQPRSADQQFSDSIRQPAPLIGLVGGVGAGKSSVPGAVRQLKLSIIDADRIGHQQLQQPETRQRLVHEFGPQILQPDGQIQRSELAARVFGDCPDNVRALATLNQIVRPGFRAEITRLLNQAPHDVDAVILDAALLLEAGWAAECEKLIFIDTPDEVRERRVAKNRNWSATDLRQREASQWPLHRKREACDVVIDNSGSLEASANQLTQIIQDLLDSRGFAAKQPTPIPPVS